MSFKRQNKPFLYPKNGIFELNASNIIEDSIYLSETTTITLPIIDCSLGNSFKIDIFSANTWRVINVPKNCLYIFSLQITDGGFATQTWFNNIKWNFGVVPTLSSSGTDVLVFLTDNGGLTWYGLLSAKDIKNQTLTKY